MPVLILYIPVIHRGYLDLINRHKKEIDAVYLMGPEIIKELRVTGYEGKELRAVSPEALASMLKTHFKTMRFSLLTHQEIDSIRMKGSPIITTDEAISRALVSEFFKTHEVKLDTAFLRWDSGNVYSQEPVDCPVSTEARDKKMMTLAIGEAKKSSDWWRQVGTVIVGSNCVIAVAHNKHLPSPHNPYIFGDPRDAIEAGKDSHLATAVHSEQSAIAEAAKHGIALLGASLYVSTFPCPMCARLIAASGVKKIFFHAGHASLDGQSVLKKAGVEIRRVVF